MLSLVMAPLNDNYKILRIKSLGDGNVTESHLANLGFVKDVDIKVLNENDGNLIVYVKDSRVAIGKDIAKKNISRGDVRPANFKRCSCRKILHR